MVKNVRYGARDNSVLRLVLHNLWSSRCYWCHRPKDFNDVQIDHIIPKDVGTAFLEDLKVEYGLPKDFDINDPQNLAPICSTCNGQRGKGSKSYGAKPVVLSQLNRAEELRPMVVARVRSFGNSTKVAEQLLRASEADLGDPMVKQAFELHAPSIVQKLALLDDTKVDFVSFRTVAITVQKDEAPFEVGISLNGRGRTAATIFQDVCGSAIESLLVQRVPELLDIIQRDVQAAFEGLEGPTGQTESGQPMSHFLRVDIDSIDYERERSSINFTFAGNFEASLWASLLQQSEDGSDLEDLQGEAQVAGTFSFDVAWDFSTVPDDVEASPCCIDSWEADIYAVP